MARIGAIVLGWLLGLAAEGVPAAPPPTAAHGDVRTVHPAGAGGALAGILRREGDPPRVRASRDGAAQPVAAGAAIRHAPASSTLTAHPAAVDPRPSQLMPGARPRGVVGGPPQSRASSQAARIDGVKMRRVR
jgi:hypothetical protein